MTPKQRSESARKAVQARWAKAKEGKGEMGVKAAKMGSKPSAASKVDTSDKALLSLLKRIKETDDQNEVRQLTEDLERLIFHKQYANT